MMQHVSRSRRLGVHLEVRGRADDRGPQIGRDADGHHVLRDVLAELDACVEGIIDRVRDQCPEHGASVVRELAAPGCTVWLEPRRLERILGNLIRNGLTHGGGTVVVRSSPGRLEIEDHGPGFPAFILETGPERFVSKGGGIGLGLTIACGQATAMGIDVTLSNASGALITLDFTDAKAPQPHPLPAHHVSTTHVSGG
jgi:signal transduction histidine kinase